MRDWERQEKYWRRFCEICESPAAMADWPHGLRRMIAALHRMMAELPR